MIGKLAIVVLLTVAAAAGGELMVRRNRRERQRRETLQQLGQSVTGTVRSSNTVSAGRHASDSVRCIVEYDVDGRSFEHVVRWTPAEAKGRAPGTRLEMLVDPNDPENAVLVGSAAPHLPDDRTFRLLPALVLVACLAAALWA